MTEPALAPVAPTPPTPAGEDARRPAKLFTKEIVWQATKESFVKLDPRHQIHNPVMFIVEIGSAITTGIAILAAFRGDGHTLWFTAVVSFWLWLTVIFANIAEAVAEGRGKAQADTLRATRTTTLAHRRTDSGAIEEVARLRAPARRPRARSARVR